MAQAAAVKPEVKKKFQFKMPHLYFIMLGLILLMSLLTYIIPAGSFKLDEAGKIIGTEFAYTGVQSPVSPWRALLMVLDGMVAAAPLITFILAMGGTIGVLLETKSFDHLLAWSTYKLQARGTSVLVPTLFILIAYIGAFSGSDALVAMVPIGIMFAKKLRLDPIVAIAITTFAALIGFGTSPINVYLPQGLMGLPIYSGFLARFLMMNIFIAIGLFFTMRYVNKIQKDPSKSAMGNTEWLKDTEAEGSEIKEASLSWRTVAILLVFACQLLAMVWIGFNRQKEMFQWFMAVNLLSGILFGIIANMKADELGKAFEKGVMGIAFVCFIIGMGRAISLIMAAGNITHTIVYAVTRPLMNLDRGFISIGLAAIISVLDLPIPSASAKAVIIMPILQPMAEALKIHPQLIVQAFQFGDGFSNIISPILGWTVGSTIIAKVPLDKWVRWSFPKAFLMLIVACVFIYILYAIGWTGM